MNQLDEQLGFENKFKQQVLDVIPAPRFWAFEAKITGTKILYVPGA
jgi:hypothetical protein